MNNYRGVCSGDRQTFNILRKSGLGESRVVSEWQEKEKAASLSLGTEDPELAVVVVGWCLGGGRESPASCRMLELYNLGSRKRTKSSDREKEKNLLVG